MVQTIYLDNAATSYPKPKVVSEKMLDYICSNGRNVGRSSYNTAYEAGDTVFETRALLAKVFNAPDARNVVFTSGVTASINMALHGLLKASDHVITTSMEHNSVIRPLMAMKDSIDTSIVRCTPLGQLKLEDLEEAITERTRAIVVTHASNVCGTVLPIGEIGNLCARKGLYFIVDAAQTAGVLDIDMEKCHIDVLCIPGHKGLMGPQGIGALLLSNKAGKEIIPFTAGGTGSASDLLEMPEFLPDKLEAGTLNIPGIYGLYGSLSYLEATTFQAIRTHEFELAKDFVNKIKDIPGIKIYGLWTNEETMPNIDNTVAVVSISIEDKEIAEVAYRLDEEYGIEARVGLHCAPLAHQTLGSFPTGTLRFSFGFYNSSDDVNKAVSALKSIL